MKTAEVERQQAVLARFTQVYCRERHRTAALCDECQELLAYARTRLEKCPFDPKPPCKNCEVHCYQRAYRDRIREVMRFSGLYFIKRGRLDWLVKYFLM